MTWPRIHACACSLVVALAHLTTLVRKGSRMPIHLRIEGIEREVERGERRRGGEREEEREKQRPPPPPKKNSHSFVPRMPSIWVIGWKRRGGDFRAAVPRRLHSSKRSIWQKRTLPNESLHSNARITCTFFSLVFLGFPQILCFHPDISLALCLLSVSRVCLKPDECGCGRNKAGDRWWFGWLE